MADQPIDINKNKKDMERLEAAKEAIHNLYTKTYNAQMKLTMRVEDLMLDSQTLMAQILLDLEELYEQFPELAPDLEDNEDFEE